MTMMKNDMIEYAALQTGLSRRDVTAVYDAIFRCVGDTLASGDEVRVHGFGIFTATPRPARTGRNPRTGETVELPATTVAKFKPARALKEAVAQA